jgi:hypothetical protein
MTARRRSSHQKEPGQWTRSRYVNRWFLLQPNEPMKSLVCTLVVSLDLLVGTVRSYAHIACELELVIVPLP